MPSRQEQGFAREQTAGLERGDPRRIFPDANAKAEIVCALSPFEALVGFREFAEICDRLSSLAPKGFEPILRDVLLAPPGGEILTLVGSVLRLERHAAASLLQEVRGRIAAGTSEGAPIARTAQLLEEYPEDPAPIAPILLHHVELATGEALFLSPGASHSYLRGVAIELMTNPDNVLRAGLTSKHIDVDALLDVLDFRPSFLAPKRVSRDAGSWMPYLDADEPFRLDRVLLKRGRPLQASSGSEPAVLLVTEGSAVLRDPMRGTSIGLGTTHVALVPACVASYELEGDGAVHRARAAGSSA